MNGDDSVRLPIPRPRENEVGGEKDAMLDLVVVVPTVRRFKADGNLAPDRYLEPMIRSLYEDLSARERAHVNFLVLNSDKQPEKHTEATGLASLGPNIHIFEKSSGRDSSVSLASQSGKLEDGREFNQEWVAWVASENLDAAFLFEKAMPLAPFILFLEDDIKPTSHALRKLSQQVRQLQSENKTDWLFLDLYTPNLEINREMLQVVNRGHYAFQCCTQAMLFKREHLPLLIEFLRVHPNEPIDDNLRHFLESERRDLSVYALRPNLFDHVGAFSSNAQKSTGKVEHTSLDFVP